MNYFFVFISFCLAPAAHPAIRLPTIPIIRPQIGDVSTQKPDIKMYMWHVWESKWKKIIFHDLKEKGCLRRNKKKKQNPKKR